MISLILEIQWLNESMKYFIELKTKTSIPQIKSIKDLGECGFERI